MHHSCRTAHLQGFTAAPARPVLATPAKGVNLLLWAAWGTPALLLLAMLAGR